MTIQRLCPICHKRVMPGSMLKIYCQGHGGSKYERRMADKETRLKWIEQNPPDQYGYWFCYLQISDMCLKRLTEQTMTIEHMTPKNRGTKFRHDLDNIKPACVPCNGLKGSRTIQSLVKDYPHLKYLLSD